MTPSRLDVFACPLEGTSLIEASAGTGKTWNLCGLYLRLLLERRLTVQQILVVTFTVAATAELRERIRARLVEAFDHLRGLGASGGDPFVGELIDSLRARMGADDADLLARLEVALQSFDEAAIFTIHAFCQRALGDLSFAAGVPAALELIVDDSDLRLQAVHDFWRRRLAGDALTPALARHLLACKDTPQAHAELLKKTMAKPLARVEWPRALDDGGAAARPFDGEAVATAHQSARRLWLEGRASIVASLLAARDGLNKNTYGKGALEAAIAEWDALAATDDAAAVPAEPGKMALLGSTKLRPNKDKAPVRPHPFFEQAQALVDAHARHRDEARLARLGLLRTMLAECAADVRKVKLARRVIAFDDMLSNVHERLAGAEGAAYAEALRGRFRAALVDEFQDTDPLQLAIFEAIYRGTECPLFLVGDPKQSIYSFRNADLHTYLKAQADADRVYTLADNQRSSAGLLDALNTLFGGNERAFLMRGLAYRPVALGSKPRAVLDDRSEPRSPLQLWSLPSQDDGSPLPKREAKRHAVAACAGEIARLLAAGQAGEITIGGAPLTGGAIAVLVRSNAQGTEMRHALAALGVASVQLSDVSLFEGAEAEELARLLAAVLEPGRERVLRAALATELLGWSAADIAGLDGDEPRLIDCVTRFAGYRATWLQRGIAAALRELLGGEGVTARLLARPDGERRLTNLRHLAEFLQAAAETQPAPEALLRWLHDQRRTIRIDEANQLRLESDRNLVQIVTIHRAKGLEYGFVFCPFLWDGHLFGANQKADFAEYHAADGTPVIDFRFGAEAAAAHDVLALDPAVEVMAETVRLVYVALTRAVHRCVVVVGSYAGKWNSSSESGRAVVNWLVAGQGQLPGPWLGGKTPPATIAAAWRALAAKAGAAAALEPLPVFDRPTLLPPPADSALLAALPAPAKIAPAWWIGSYSSLAHGSRHEGAAVDHDGRVVDADADVDIDEGSDNAHEAAPSAEAAAIEAPADDDILRFPRGAEAGQLLHALLEQIDFSDASTFAPAATELLRGEAEHLGGTGSAPLLGRMLTRMLGDLTRSALPGGIRLAELRRERCLVELEFNLPARGLGAAQLADVLRRHGYPVPLLSFQSLSGYLRGFIDLVFEWRGRFHIADWKSNHLGADAAAYGHGPLARAMARHGYHLQLLLYTVAVHRYLQKRLPDYRYADHFGSVLYVFVRGVRPGWRNADGSAAGVHAHRPPLAVVDALSRLLDGEQEAA